MVNLNGFARIYVLASEIVAYTDANINHNNLYQLLESYQRKKELGMEEIWSISLFLNIALIENIRRICEEIYRTQIQKIRVEEIIEKTIGNEENERKPFDKREYKKRYLKEDELKYSFIEYLSYRLRKYGKKADAYRNALEEITNKLGTDVASIIKKEHFQVAQNKVSMGNSITSMKTIQRVNFLEIFEKLNSVEEILKQDPAQVYAKMDLKTKEWYRNTIKKLAKKNQVSEIYLAKKALALAQKEETEKRKKHIGYYLIENGVYDLVEIIRGQKVKRISNDQKVNLYITSLVGITIGITALFGFFWYQKVAENIILTILFIFLSFPILLCSNKLILQYLLSKFIKPRPLPKLDLQNGVTEEYTTMIVIPTILNSKGKVKEFFEKLEVFYLANRSDNLYFTLLGDCQASSKETLPQDQEILAEGFKQIQILNQKYPGENQRFHFFYRKRTWSNGEACFLGWERKRGLLAQLNEYLVQGESDGFLYSSFRKDEEKEIRYVITLDADTDLVLDTGFELIGAMAHILNHPQLNKRKDKVVQGHGIIQPRIGIDLEASIQTGFTQVFAGNGRSRFLY